MMVLPHGKECALAKVEHFFVDGIKKIVAVFNNIYIFVKAPILAGS